MADFQRILAEHSPQPGYCLVLRPFNESADRAWSAIKLQLEATFHWTDIKDLIRSGTIMDQVLEQIARTDVVIVDITGDNPNVFFELGIARASKPQRKVLIVRRAGDADDRPVTSDAREEGVVPFDVRSDRYLSFATTEDGIKAMLPLLAQRLSDALQDSQWFLLGEGEIHTSRDPLEGAGDSSLFIVEVRPTRFIGRQFGPNAHRVHVAVTVRPVTAFERIGPDLPTPQVLTGSLGKEETMALGSLPWTLKFHRFEADKARFCLETTSRP